MKTLLPVSWASEDCPVETEEERDTFVVELVKDLVRGRYESTAPNMSAEVELQKFEKIMLRYKDVHFPDLNGFLIRTQKEMDEKDKEIANAEEGAQNVARQLEEMKTREATKEARKKGLKRQLTDVEDREAKTRAQLRQTIKETKVQLVDALQDREQREETAVLQKALDDEAEKRKQREETAALRKALEDEAEKRLCQLCVEKLKDTVLFPCKHLQYCHNCVLRVWRRQKTCPVCRQVVTAALKCIM